MKERILTEKKVTKLKLNKKTVLQLGRKQNGNQQHEFFFQTWDDIITGCTSRMTNDVVKGQR